MILMLVLTSFMLFGQKKGHSSSKNKFYLGFNSTNVIKNLLSFTSNETDDPYTLVGLYSKKKMALRFGLGVNFKTTQNDKTILADNSYSKIDIRFGFQRSKKMWNNLFFTYGLDIIAGWEKDFTVRESFYNTEISWSGGGGPVLGVLFHVNDRLSLSTESSFYFRYTNKTSKFKPVWSEEEVDVSDVYVFRHVLPNALYVYFRL